MVLMTESSIPMLGATVAAPIQKLCPAKFSSGKPTAFKASLTFAVKWPLVRGCHRDVERKDPFLSLALIHSA